MRILIVADVHANWAALRCLNEPHDVCFFLGDLVDYGLEPRPCIQWARERVHYAVRGNHDHAVAQRAATNGRNGLKYLSSLTRQLTWEGLDPLDLRYLCELPVTRSVTLQDTRFFLVHGTPRDPLEEYASEDTALWARRLRNVQADVVCVGHTHVPYAIEVEGKTVINPGSLGQPRDGDPRGAYAVWEDGRVELKRLAYPVEEAVRAVESSRLPEPAKRLAAAVYRTGVSAEVNRLLDAALPEAV